MSWVYQAVASFPGRGLGTRLIKQQLHFEHLEVNFRMMCDALLCSDTHGARLVFLYAECGRIDLCMGLANVTTVSSK